jgi:hypothetical protein
VYSQLNDAEVLDAYILLLSADNMRSKSVLANESFTPHQYLRHSNEEEPV